MVLKHGYILGGCCSGCVDRDADAIAVTAERLDGLNGYMFYSLLASCQLLEVNPSAYLRAAVDRLLLEPKTPFLPTDFQNSLDAEDAEVAG